MNVLSLSLKMVYGTSTFALIVFSSVVAGFVAGSGSLSFGDVIVSFGSGAIRCDVIVLESFV